MERMTEMDILITLGIVVAALIAGKAIVDWLNGKG